MVGLAGESEQMVPIWTVGAFLSSLDRCVRHWLGRSRSEGCLGRGVMEPLREYSSHAPHQTEGDPSHPCQRHASSEELHQRTSIRVFSENSTIVQALLNQGSSRTLSATKEVQDILSLCKRKSLSIFPHKIPGRLSVLVDALSRDAPLPGEWECEAVNSTQRTEPGPWQLSQVCRWT